MIVHSVCRLCPPRTVCGPHCWVFWSLELFLTQLGQLKDTEDAGRHQLRKEMLEFLTSHQALVSFLITDVD